MSFTKDIDRFAKRTGRKVQYVRRAVTLKLFGSVVLDTPVLSGRLRGNWRISEGVPKTAPLDRKDKGGQIVMAEIQSATMASNGDQSLYLTNNLPYAARIEYDGWSHTKAPEGMVRKNVVRFQGLIRLENATKSS